MRRARWRISASALFAIAVSSRSAGAALGIPDCPESHCAAVSQDLDPVCAAAEMAGKPFPIVDPAAKGLCTCACGGDGKSPAQEPADSSLYPAGSVAHASDPLGVYSISGKGGLRLALTLDVDPLFTADQRAVLARATAIFLDRALSPAVIGCAYGSADRDLPSSREDFEARVLEALTPRRTGDLVYPGILYVARIASVEGVAGRGYVGFFHDQDRPLPGYPDRHALYVAVNVDYLGGKEKPLSESGEYWASVLAHEALHNLGYRHPNGYRGSFVYEYTMCLWGDGLRVPDPVGGPLDQEIGKGH